MNLTNERLNWIAIITILTGLVLSIFGASILVSEICCGSNHRNLAQGFQFTTNFISSISTFTLALIAGLGYYNWKHQFKYQRDTDDLLAARVMAQNLATDFSIWSIVSPCETVDERKASRDKLVDYANLLKLPLIKIHLTSFKGKSTLPQAIRFLIMRIYEISADTDLNKETLMQKKIDLISLANEELKSIESQLDEKLTELG